MAPQLTRPSIGDLIRLVSALLLFDAPALGFAHNSTKEAETQIDTRERYVELADQVAPIFVLQDTEANSMRLDDAHSGEGENFLADVMPPTEGRPIDVLTALVRLGILAGIAFYYYWNRRHRPHAPPVKNPVSPSQGGIR